MDTSERDDASTQARSFDRLAVDSLSTGNTVQSLINQTEGARWCSG